MEIERAYVSFCDFEYTNGTGHVSDLWRKFRILSGEKSLVRSKTMSSPNLRRLINQEFTKIDNAIYWHLGGVLHREKDYPAIITDEGIKEYYKDGILCRDPVDDSAVRAALYNPDGSKTFAGSKAVLVRSKNKLATTIKSNGDMVFYVGNGRHLTVSNSGSWTYRNSEGRFDNDAGPAFLAINMILYMRDGKSHRDPEDGPASTIISRNGGFTTYRYFVNGLETRGDSGRAAVVSESGSKTFFNVGKKQAASFRASEISSEGIVKFHSSGDLSRIKYPASINKDGILEFALYGIVFQTYDASKDIMHFNS